jgi:RimJ/RimL family protein N-acetyltransferase
MIEFIPMRADFVNGKFENQQYLPYVLETFHKYKNLLTDDYYPENNFEMLSQLIAEINELYPWFLLCLYDKKPAGAAWVSHWHGNDKKIHSCQIQCFVEKKYWGRKAIEMGNELLKLLFEDYQIERVQMEVPEFNIKAIAFVQRLGFVREGIVRCATFKKNKPLNHILFSKLRGEHLNGKK